MPEPWFFSWVEEPFLAASAAPSSAMDLHWLRSNGIDIIVTLTEYPLPRNWIDEAGLMSVHIPISDMTAPSVDQLLQCNDTIRKARDSKMGVLVHCMAGRGRTGTALAGFLIGEGVDPHKAIERIRQLRPGSIETYGQEHALLRFADSIKPSTRE